MKSNAPGFKITQFHAFISADEDGTEGLIGALNERGEWTPFVCADEDRVQSILPIAQRIAKQSGRTITLARFSLRTDLREIKP